MKSKLDDLAIFGGTPLFSEPVHVGRPNIGDRGRFLERVNDILDRKWLTNSGRYAEEFERQVAEMTGVAHCIAMCNATVALEHAIRALDLSGDVIVPSFTFIATPNALQWQEITPVFCDVDPTSHNLDPARVESMITPRTTGIIGVHLWGRACDVAALAEIAERHHLRLLFDAAHALGCSHQGQMIGGFGEAEVFSFHATKFVNSFEGGVVTTNSRELAQKLRLMRNFGFTDYDMTEHLGSNGKMSEVSAAMGVTGIEAVNQVVATNRRNYLDYLRELRGIEGLSVLQYDEAETSNYQYIVCDVDRDRVGISRDQVVSLLHAENVLARRYFYPGCHRMEPYRSLFPHAGLLLPITESLAARVLVLPTGTSVSSDMIGRICSVLRLVLQTGPEAANRMGC